jgi:hypothetical protein
MSSALTLAIAGTAALITAFAAGINRAGAQRALFALLIVLSLGAFAAALTLSAPEMFPKQIRVAEHALPSWLQHWHHPYRPTPPMSKASANQTSDQ